MVATPACFGPGEVSCISEDHPRDDPVHFTADLPGEGTNHRQAFVYEMARYLVNASCLCIELNQSPQDPPYRRPVGYAQGDGAGTGGDPGAPPPPVAPPAPRTCWKQQPAEGAPRVAMCTDTDLILIPFNPERVPAILDLHYVGVEPPSHKEWMERKGFEWEPYEDPFYWQLAFDPNTAIPSMLPTPDAAGSNLAPGADMQASIDAIRADLSIEPREVPLPK